MGLSASGIGSSDTVKMGIGATETEESEMGIAGAYTETTGSIGEGLGWVPEMSASIAAIFYVNFYLIN